MDHRVSKLSKRELLLKTYNAFIDLSFQSGSTSQLKDVANANLMAYGTTHQEKFTDVQSYLAFALEKWSSVDLNNIFLVRNIILEKMMGDAALIVEEIDMKFSGNLASNNMFLRVSTILEYQDNQWKVIHGHCSNPKYVDLRHHEDSAIEKERLKQQIVLKNTALRDKDRELEIEAALERVRKGTMDMHKSEDLKEVVSILYNQIEDLDLGDWGCNIEIFNAADECMEIWLAEKTDTITARKYILKSLDHPEIQLQWDAWKNREPELYVTLEGVRKKSYDNYVIEHTDFSHFPKELKAHIRSMDRAYFSQAGMQYGFIVAIRRTGLLSKEEMSILKRFANVFEQSYSRFLSLQKLETQAKEAQIELALEKVRTRAMIMRSTDELANLIITIFHELKKLDIELTRCLLWIFNTNDHSAIAWMTNSENPNQADKYFVDYHEHPAYLSYIAGWKQGEKTWEYDLKGEDKTNWDKILVDVYFNALPSYIKQAMKTPSRVILSGSFNKYGMIQTAGYKKLTLKNHKIVQRFSQVFEQTYTRFLDLQKAEAQAKTIKEERDRINLALFELKTTQAQLIQSEKMASLGELTAGIAHEIQNPLNFVNNFSEVSTEMIEELYEELAKGDINEAKSISNDLKQNLEKITHHGKRADSIVKGMLQHSRVGTGEMVETDINSLCDEYMRLAYHGLRAKDKSFNADIEMTLQNALAKIKVVPQDISRVILNIMTNAFQAIQAKSQNTAKTTYSPKVICSTLSEGDKVIITISDNGMGIPEDIREKIFQPFFTTKPTGQGTGLGLSMAYDIVKAHGGELSVESEVGKETDFKIVLPL